MMCVCVLTCLCVSRLDMHSPTTAKEKRIDNAKSATVGPKHTTHTPTLSPSPHPLSATHYPTHHDLAQTNATRARIKRHEIHEVRQLFNSSKPSNTSFECSHGLRFSWVCVLQHVAVCCSMLQCVAVCCSVLQCVAACCSVLQCVAVHGTSFSKWSEIWTALFYQTVTIVSLFFSV